MIEGRGLFPIRGTMTRFTGQFRFVRILVAPGAGKRSEMELAACIGRGNHRDQRLRGNSSRTRGKRFVTAFAWNCGMFAGQGEARLYMLGHLECRRLERLLGVAEVALIVRGRRGELARVRIGVALRADQRTQDIHRAAALRLVALPASKRSVLALQGERGVSMGLPVEQRRLEARLVVAGLAVRPGCARQKLSAVLVLVTALTLIVRHSPVEVDVLVAAGACHFRVLSLQRKWSLGVTEARARLRVLPTIGDVATLTSSPKLRVLKRAAVRIGVAILAALEFQALELKCGYSGHLARTGCMALHARHRLVLSGKREFRLRMVEAGDRLPGVHRVAASAFGPKLAAMLILVTGEAFPAQSEKGVVGVLELDLLRGRRRKLLRVVTRFAPKRPVLSL